MKNFNLVGTLIAAFKLVGKQPIIDIAQALYTSNPSLYGAIIGVVNFGLSEAQIAAAKTTTTVDDDVVAALREVVKASADKNGITLL